MLARINPTRFSTSIKPASVAAVESWATVGETHAGGMAADKDNVGTAVSAGQCKTLMVAVWALGVPFHTTRQDT